MGLTRKEIIIALLIKRRERGRNLQVMKSRRVRVRQLYRERKEKGEYRSLIKEMQVVDEMLFYIIRLGTIPYSSYNRKLLPVSLDISSGFKLK